MIKLVKSEVKRQELSKTFVNQEHMMRRIEELYQNVVFEKDEHKKTTEYKKLSPKMRNAVDSIFKTMDAKPSDFLNTFEKTIKKCQKIQSSRKRTHEIF